ncbi:hypothetical protein AB0D34_06445 [Streptomyces sp. NPDC048420]|uniref:hypothetical protein n=1 Tax=Streptomyces sp. NPDC048420 TaxID=3155755 RepID=UPI00343518F8
MSGRPGDERALLGMLDTGEGLSAHEQALLLAGAEGSASDIAVAELPLGVRDRRILRLRGLLFGASVNVQDTCPHCAEVMTCTLTLHQLNDVATPSAVPARVEADGWTVICRALTSADLTHALRASDRAEARLRLLTSCVVDAERDGLPVPTAQLPPPVAASVVEAVAEADPFAEIRLRLVCAQCGGSWDAVLDPARYVWCELAEWGRRLTENVHVLARAYGWREDDVLALPASRRAVYLGLVGDG